MARMYKRDKQGRFARKSGGSSRMSPSRPGSGAKIVRPHPIIGRMKGQRPVTPGAVLKSLGRSQGSIHTKNSLRRNALMHGNSSQLIKYQKKWLPKFAKVSGGTIAKLKARGLAHVTDVKKGYWRGTTNVTRTRKGASRAR